MRIYFLVSIFCFAACSDAAGRHGGSGGSGGGGGAGSDLASTQPNDSGVVYYGDGGAVVQDPQTCTDAAANKSYIGCDYWPTVVANQVWSIFDFAVVVSNPGSNPAMVTVTGGAANTNQMVTVMPGTIQKIYLPWDADLKGADASAAGSVTNPLTKSVYKAKGAYHLVSSVPVLVYQFNALEYAPMGGAPGKDWSKCPGTGGAFGTPCFSYSNDASLLLPSTAMTGNYRVLTEHGVDGASSIFGMGTGIAAYMAITATADNTTIKVQVSKTGQITAGNNAMITAVAAGGTATYTLNAGDVVELVSAGATASDLSGSLVQATQPVQVIGGVPCISNPLTTDPNSGMPYTCDHVEESVLPAETLGKTYVVNMPTAPDGTSKGGTVRLVGNVDGTTLTYDPAVAGAPATLSAGQVVEFDASADFMVSGDHEFAVGIVQKSGDIVDPQSALSMTPSMGDPSLSLISATEQFRVKYVFLAPDDYEVNYADIVAPMGAHLMLDGAAVTATPSAIGGSGYGVYRLKLSNANGGAHTVTADQPVGLQALGYGSYTSYQYPAGLDLVGISAPPPPIS